MATFDQRGQHVRYQYNAETINFASAQNTMDVIEELKHLQQELARAIDKNALAGDDAIEADYEMKKALAQAGNAAPEKKTLLKHLSTVKNYVTGISGLAGAFAQAITTVGQFF